MHTCTHTVGVFHICVHCPEHTQWSFPFEQVMYYVMSFIFPVELRLAWIPAFSCPSFQSARKCTDLHIALHLLSM